MTLPFVLQGPNKSIDSESYDEFLLKAQTAYPELDRDFILQICFEHPNRFNGMFPEINFSIHRIRRIRRSATWINKNIRYERNKCLVGFWSHHFDNPPPLLENMLENKTWSFPPVIVEASVAKTVFASDVELGRPWHLVEGTHRVSYLLNMLKRGEVNDKSEHELLKLVAE